jgi:hypothetical protein
MHRITYVLVATSLALLTASCSLFGIGQGGGVEVTLQPESASLDQNLTLTVTNSTEAPIRYHCGYEVQTLNGGQWSSHRTVGCVGTAMPVSIAPGETYKARIGLFAREPGTYRMEAFVTTQKGEDVSEAGRITNPVEVTQ